MEYYEASGIVYHCKYCKNTVTMEFLLGDIVLPLKDNEIEKQNKLKIKYGTDNLLMHDENCICSNCLPKLANYQRVLSNSEIFSKKNKIIIKYKHESEIVNEKIMNYYKDRLDNFLLKLDISAFFNQNNINFDPTAYKGMNEVEFINKIDSFVKSNYSKMKSIVFESFDQKYLSEILKESNELSKIYYKAFKTLKNDDWTENEIYLKPCKPINSLDISEYLKVNDNIDEHILDCKENDDELKIYELCTINPIQLGFPLSAFDAYNIFDVMLNNTRFKDKITDKLVKACKNAVKSSK